MVYIFLADGFEEIEAITPIDILRRAGIEVKTISITDTLEVTGGHGITVLVDEIFEEEDFSDADMLILPGGGKGTEKLSKHEGFKKLILEHNKNNKYIAAICAAPTILGQMKLLDGKTATCYPGLEEKLIGAKIKVAPVVVDGNIITSRGAGTAHNMSFKIITLLKGKEVAEKLNETTIFKRKFEVMIKESL